MHQSTAVNIHTIHLNVHKIPIYLNDTELSCRRKTYLLRQPPFQGHSLEATYIFWKMVD